MEKKLKKMLSKWNVLTIALIAMMSVQFTSCSSDSDPEPEGSDSIIGKWVAVDDGSFSFTFSANGTGYLQDKTGSRNFNYTYEPSTKKLSIWFVDDSKVLNFSVSRTGDTLMLSQGSSTIVLKRG